MSTLESTLTAERAWLERIQASKVIGFCVLDESRALVQCIDDDPDLRDALIEYKQQRIRELERGLGLQPSPVAYPVREDDMGSYAPDEQLSEQEAAEIFSPYLNRRP